MFPSNDAKAAEAKAPGKLILYLRRTVSKYECINVVHDVRNIRDTVGSCKIYKAGNLHDTGWALQRGLAVARSISAHLLCWLYVVFSGQFAGIASRCN